jgi:hypothetical protein
MVWKMLWIWGFNILIINGGLRPDGLIHPTKYRIPKIVPMSQIAFCSDQNFDHASFVAELAAG